MNVSTIEPEFVEFVPAELTAGVLYVSMTYATTVHLCACGCGNKVVLPLSPAQWQLYFDGDTVSLTPSVGNWEFTCRSHYWIKNNKIRWAARWSDEQVAHASRRDAGDLDAYFSAKRAPDPASVEPAEQVQPPAGPWRRLLGWFRR